MSRFARKSCINCSADLETAEDNQSTAFYNLNCSSRVRSPLSPATVELIPVPHALSTIFNFETLKKVSSSHSSSDTERDSYFGIGMENPLKDFESSASSVPICYVCYLVLSDLYRIYTEFSQLRKTNSFLGSKLLELENCLKKSQKCSKTNSKRSKNSMHPNPNQVSVSRVNASFAAAGAAPNIISSDLPLRLHPHQGLGTSSQTLPFHTHNELTSLNLGEAAPTVSTMSLQSESNSSLHLHDEVEDSPLDFVKVEVYQELDSEGDMDMENTGGVTEDEEGGEGGADYEDESIELPSSSFHLASIAEGNYAPVSAGDHNMDPLATQKVDTLPNKWEPPTTTTAAAAVSAITATPSAPTRNTVSVYNPTDGMSEQYTKKVQLQRDGDLSKSKSRRDSHVNFSGGTSQSQQQNIAARLPANSASYYSNARTKKTALATAPKKFIISKPDSSKPSAVPVVNSDAGIMGGPSLLNRKSPLPRASTSTALASAATPISSSKPMELVAKVFKTVEGTRLVFQTRPEKLTSEILQQIQSQLQALQSKGATADILPGSTIKFQIQP